MSQFYVGVTAGSLPPVVATSYVTDVNSPAIPAGNILNVLGGDTTANSDNGIRTDGSSGSDTVTVQLTNRISVTATTSDGAGQTQSVTLFTPTNASAVEFSVNIIGYDAINNECCGGSMEGIARKSAGGTLVIVGSNDTLDESDDTVLPVLSGADWDVIVSGADLNMQFVGVATRTVSWRALLQYTQVS